MQNCSALTADRYNHEVPFCRKTAQYSGNLYRDPDSLNSANRLDLVEDYCHDVWEDDWPLDAIEMAFVIC